MSNLCVGLCWVMLMVLRRKILSSCRATVLSGHFKAHLGVQCGHFGTMLALGYLIAMLMPFWDHLGAHVDGMWGYFVPCCFGTVKNNLKRHLRNAPPGPKGETESNQKPPQNTKPLQNANLHGNQGKTQPNILPKSTFKMLSPVQSGVGEFQFLYIYLSDLYSCHREDFG